MIEKSTSHFFLCKYRPMDYRQCLFTFAANTHTYINRSLEYNISNTYFTFTFTFNVFVFLSLNISCPDVVFAFCGGVCSIRRSFCSLREPVLFFPQHPALMLEKLLLTFTMSETDSICWLFASVCSVLLLQTQTEWRQILLWIQRQRQLRLGTPNVPIHT